MIIEVTTNKDSKLIIRWLSILKNEKQLLVHSRNCNNIACICNALYRPVGTNKGVCKHTESYLRRLKEEEVAQGLLNCISELKCFPIDPTAPALQTLHSVKPATDKLVADLKSAFADREAELFDSAPKNKPLTFANETKHSLLGKDKVTTGIPWRVWYWLQL